MICVLPALNERSRGKSSGVGVQDGASETSNNVPSAENVPRFRMALVAWTGSDAAALSGVLKGTNVEIVSLTKEEFSGSELSDCGVVVFRAIGWNPTDADREALARLKQKTNTVGYPQTLDLAVESTNCDAELAAKLGEYVSFFCEDNARSFAALCAERFGGDGSRDIRSEEGKILTEFSVRTPLVPPVKGYFYWGSEISKTYEEFEARRVKEGRDLPEDAPRVALFGSFLEPFKALERKPQDELIAKLESRGYNVYPIYNLEKDPELLTRCKPDAAIYFPRGRVLSNESAPTLFARIDCPVLTAVCLSASEREWRAEPIGATGSYYALTTALPELDGVIEPTPIATREPNEDGVVVRTPLGERIDALVDRVGKHIALRRKSNAEKKIAVFYYKAPGAAALTAQSLEVVDSLYNTLLFLRDEGYDLGPNLPNSPDELRQRIDREGRTIGQWELGTLERFVEEARPELVPQNLYAKWFKEELPEEARKKVLDAWGPAPGAVMTRDVGDQYGALVPRVQFGNVVLLPQPTTDVVEDAPYSPLDDDFAAVHGTNKAPPHFYIAAYLWARRGFNADAIVHFGTHGSLEFTQGKSGFLTESCFPDALIGDCPHVYLYSINNIGEAFLAKRRSRAALVSHLTPPFVKSGLYGDLETLDTKMHEYAELSSPALKEEYARSIAEAALRSALVDDLAAEPEFQQFASLEFREKFEREKQVFTEEQFEKLHRLLHRYENVNVADGLHVLGRPWTEEQIAETAEIASEPQETFEPKLRASFALELERFAAALSGRYIPPSTGGDYLVNPESLPTGRNLAGLNAEKLPSLEAERLAARLTDELIGAYRAKNEGAFPRRVACTLWGGETTRTQGLGVAQVLYLLGVRIKRDSRGSASQLELIPDEELGRPRIDVFVQTSGQFRDAFASKIETIDRAVRLAVDAPENELYPNFARENSLRVAERLRDERNMTDEDAKEASTARVFGATNALSYGTGVMRLIERSDLWQDESQIADRYIANMSGVYRGAQHWGVPIEGLLEMNLEGLDLAVQTRSSNVWGPAKLDHIYEFATLAAAARAKTGKDVEFWFDDLRNPNEARVESVRAALKEELRATIWNPRYLQGLQREGASALESASKTIGNLFGWNVAQPNMIDRAVWEETKAVFIDDARQIGVRKWFEEKNPAALQDISAVMLESIRKGYWNADAETTKQIAELHAELVVKYGAPGSYRSTGNRELRKFVGKLLDDPTEYERQMQKALEASKPHIEGLGLKEVADEERTKETQEAPVDSFWLITALVCALAFAALGFWTPRPRVFDR